MTTTNLTPGVAYNNVAMCALVLEDNPVGQDSKLVFESFPPDGIEESYSVSGYREIAADRMPQPGFVAYRGGNWSSFSLELKFRAGNSLGRVLSLSELNVADLEGILTEMERKVRWCQALCFPLPRDSTTLKERVIANARANGIAEEHLRSISSAQLPRNDPPFVLVQFGTWLTLRCYCLGYSLRWEHPFHPVTVQPYGCTVHLSFQRIDLDYPTWQSVRNAGGKLPQSPNTRTVQGSVLVRDATRGLNQAAADNSEAVSLAISAGQAGTSAAAFLSVGRS